MRHLQRHHPVLALRVTDAAGESVTLDGIEEAGSASRSCSPGELGAGPCLFAGFSYAGVTAYETAGAGARARGSTSPGSC